MGVLFRMALMVLDEGAGEAGDELAQLLELDPGLAAKLLAVVDREGDLSGNPVAAEPGDCPER